MNKNSFTLRGALNGIGILFLGISSQVSAQNLLAKNDFYGTQENTGSSDLHPLDNDISATILNLSVEVTQAPKNGTFVLKSSDFTFQYTPNNEFTGRDTINYEICDLDNVEPCSSAKIIVAVGIVPLNPLAVKDTDTTGQSKAITYDVLANDSIRKYGIVPGNFVKYDVVTSSHIALDSMIVQIDVNPKNGTASILANKIVYTPADGFSGLDTVYYSIVDPKQYEQGIPSDHVFFKSDSSAQSFLAIYVNKLHSAGNEIGDTIFLPQTSIKTKNVLKNNIDTDGDKLYVSNFGTSLTQVNDGVNNTDTKDSIFTYTPQVGFAGIDTVIYEVCSKLNDNPFIDQCVKDTLFIVVMPSTINEIPVITINPIRDTIIFGQTGMITLSATDKQDLTIQGITDLGPDLKVKNISAIPNTLTFEYDKGTATRTQTDTIKVNVCEVVATTSCATATVILTLIDNTPKPKANDDYKKTKEAKEVSIAILKNDIINGSKLAITTQPKNGIVAVTSAGDTFKYTPNPGFYGTDTIYYSLCRDSCDIALVVIEVEPFFDAKIVQGVSPDGDGINDVFTIQDIDYKLNTVHVKIYNRWGTEIYSETNYDANDSEKSWKGQSKNNTTEVVDGTYFYIVEIAELDFKDSGYLVFIGNK